MSSNSLLGFKISPSKCSRLKTPQRWRWISQLGASSCGSWSCFDTFTCNRYTKNRDFSWTNIPQLAGSDWYKWPWITTVSVFWWPETKNWINADILLSFVCISNINKQAPASLQSQIKDNRLIWGYQCKIKAHLRKSCSLGLTSQCPW